MWAKEATMNSQTDVLINRPASEVSDLLWTVEDVAAYLRLKPSTVRDLARKGGLPVIKLGRFYRFRKADLDAWLEKCP